MRKLIFLDFDGVLHGERDPVFARLPHFEEVLIQMPDVEIVVSSSWRESHNLAKLRAPFRAEMRERIIGITPTLEDGYTPGGRQREIESYLQNAKLWKHNAHWIAIDDIAFFFDPDCPYLLLTNAATGFTQNDGQHLMRWYRAAKPA